MVLLVSMEFHMSVKTAMTSSRPQKKWYVQANGASGSPPRPKKNGCHGARLLRHGTPLASHWSATGLTVSGVEPARTRSTWSDRMRSAAASPATVESDWVSLTMISTGLRPAPVWIGLSAKYAVSASMTKLSASPNGASGPVCGVT